MSRRVNKLALAAVVTALSTGMVGCKKQESSEALVAQAKQYQQKGDTPAAMIQLKNALLANPDDAEARFMLAEAYVENGDGVGAEKEVRRALALKYPANKAMPVLATALLAQGLLQKVLDDTAEEAAKNDPNLLAIRADALLVLKKPADATAQLDAALRANPTHVGALIGKARGEAMAGNFDAAMKFVDMALAAAPKDTTALVFRADVLRAQHKNDEALEVYAKVLEIKPNHRSAHIEKAYLEISSGKYDAAQADLNAAKKVTPGSLLVTYTQAMLDFTQGKNSAAEEGLQKVLRSSPDHLPSILLAGAVALRQGSLQQAEQHLKKYVERAPNNVYARKMLAATLLRSGQAQDALSALTPALKDATDVQVLSLAGESYMQARDFGKASEVLAKAADMDPKSSAVHTQLGLSKLQKGDSAGAVKEMELATSLDPKSVQAGLTLVRVELSLGHYDKARIAADKLLQLQPDNAVVHDLRGLVLVGNKDMAGARASFEKARALQPAYYQAAANLAMLSLAEKKPAEAKAALLAFLEKNKKSADAMTGLAGLASNERNIPEATKWLEQAQAENPEAVAPARRLISQYLMTNQPQKALALARKVQVSNASDPGLLDLLAKSQLASKDFNGALESYSKLAAAQPKSAQVQLALASTHMMLKNPSAAEEDLKKALVLQPDYPEAQVALAELMLRKKQPDQAIALARQIQKKHPEAAGGFQLEGDILMTQGKPALAQAAYEKAQTLAPKAVELVLKTASAMRAAGKQADADKRLAQAQQQNPKDLRIPMFRVEQFLAEKQYKTAAEQLEALLKQSPNNVAVLNNLAFTYQQLDDARATPTAEAAYKQASQEPAIMDTLGWILVSKGGDAKRGLSLLQQASTKAPEARDIRYHLAVGLFKSGDKIGARKEVEQVLAGNQQFAQADEARALLQQLK